MFLFNLLHKLFILQQSPFNFAHSLFSFTLYSCPSLLYHSTNPSLFLNTLHSTSHSSFFFTPCSFSFTIHFPLPSIRFPFSVITISPLPFAPNLPPPPCSSPLHSLPLRLLIHFWFPIYSISSQLLYSPLPHIQPVSSILHSSSPSPLSFTSALKCVVIHIQCELHCGSVSCCDLRPSKCKMQDLIKKWNI